MSDILVIDDMFVDAAWDRFQTAYGAVYGDEVKGPLDYQRLVMSCAAVAHREPVEAHVFYLPERFSATLRTTARAEVIRRFGEHDTEESDIPDDVVHIALHAFNVTLPEFLSQIPGLTFHECEWLEPEASEFILQCPSAGGLVLVGDDWGYTNIPNPSNTVLLRRDNQSTNMPEHVRWQDMSYVFCHAYGVPP